MDAKIKVELDKWRGYSAYEVAVQNGYNGTQKEWLEDLKGGKVQITVNGKVVDTDGDIKLYATDIPMEDGALKTVHAKINELDDEKAEVYTTSIGLPAGSWSSLTQTVSVSGVTADNIVLVTPAPGSYTEYHGCGVFCSSQGSGTLTFSAVNKPDNALTVQILLIS